MTAPSSSSVAMPLYEGVFAINKPAGKTSAQIVRDCVHHFSKSQYFRPWLVEEQERRRKEGFRQRNRRNKSHKKVQVKVGHAGTLDPSATGVLVIGVGSGTKQLQKLLESSKIYEAVVLFGAATDSYDLDGKLLATAEYGHVTKEKVEKALVEFRGDIQQRPPIFSALKMDGMALYEYARNGKELPREIALRSVKVHSLDLTEWLEPESHEYKWPSQKAAEEGIKAAYKLLDLSNSTGRSAEAEIEAVTKRKRSASPSSTEPNKEQKLEADAQEGPSVEPAQPGTPADDLGNESSERPPAAKLRMDVGSGFYVRSLCHDLGKAVGSLGLMAHLVRTKQGPFFLGQNVLDYDDLEAGEDTWQPKIQAKLQEWDEHVASMAETKPTSNNTKREDNPEK